LKILALQRDEVCNLFTSLTEKTSLHRYHPEKWSVKEVIGHSIDAERVFSYRAMCFARGEKTPLPSMDENSYVANAAF